MAKKAKPHDYKRIFNFYHIDIEGDDSEQKLDCPFCQKEEHFFLNLETSEFSCKSCFRGGNIYVFLRELHDVLLELTSLDDYRELSAMKPGMGAISLNNSKIARLTDTEWLIPSYNADHNIIALRKYDTETNKILSCPTMSSGFYIARNDQDSDLVYICEGEWDAVAWKRILHKNKEAGSVISVPGASNFPDRYYELYAQKRVILLYDNDEPKDVNGHEMRPGWEGMKLAYKRMQASPTPPTLIEYNAWTDIPAPMDIRDYCAENFKRPKRVYNDITSFISPGTELGASSNEETRTHNVEIPIIDSFEDVLAEFAKVYEVNDTFEKCLATGFATCISNLIDGEPLWMFLVGPASSGKTTIIESFALCEDHTFHLSKLSATAFVSGRAMGDTDPSILPHLRQKCLFVKDFTAILSMPNQTQEELFGILRDSYDGSLRIRYGNGIERLYNNLNFSMFAGCTDSIHTKNHSSLGERFLKIEILDPSFSPAAQTRAALMGYNLKPSVLNIQAHVCGYLRYLFKSFTMPEEVPMDIIDWLVSISQIVAYLRTTITRQEGHMAYRPRPEIPSRIALQLKKYYQSLTVAVPGRDPEWYKSIIQKASIDSCVGWSLEFVREVLRRPDGITTQEIASIVQVSVPHVRKVLQDMQELQVVELGTRANNSGRSGRNANVWFPNSAFLEIWETASVDTHYHRKRTPSRKAKRNRKRSTV